MKELSIFDLMLPAFAECLVLVGIHSYLGLHVIRRKVIFVDLALAQVAALGTTIGFLFGMAPDSTAALIFSMLFTFVGAAIFSITRLRGDRIPQEAIIGLVYALAAAVIILIVDRAPHGAEHIKEVMTGAILWVRWEKIAIAAAVYGGVGLFHYIFRKQFILISNNPEQAYASGMYVRLWDFLFYLSFGVVISISVQTAGVLLVFIFLVVPAIAASLVTDRLFYQLLIGWGIGVLVSLLGLSLSYYGDMPSGPTVVSFYGFMLVIVALILYVFKAPQKRRAVFHLIGGLGITIVTVLLLFIIGHFLGQSKLAVGWAKKNPSLHANETEAEQVIKTSKNHLSHYEPKGLLDVLLAADETKRDVVLDGIDIAHQNVLVETYKMTADSNIRLLLARHIFSHDKAMGACLLYQTLIMAESPFVREETVHVIEQLAKQKLELDVESPINENSPAILKLKEWLQGTGCTLE